MIFLKQWKEPILLVFTGQRGQSGQSGQSGPTVANLVALSVPEAEKDCVVVVFFPIVSLMKREVLVTGFAKMVEL